MVVVSEMTDDEGKRPVQGHEETASADSGAVLASADDACIDEFATAAVPDSDSANTQHTERSVKASEPETSVPFFDEILGHIEAVTGRPASALSLKHHATSQISVRRKVVYTINYQVQRERLAGRLRGNVDEVEPARFDDEMRMRLARAKAALPRRAEAWIAKEAPDPCKCVTSATFASEEAPAGYTTTCRGCGGIGRIDCGVCNQSGVVSCGRCTGSGREQCGSCYGRGRVSCHGCGGLGTTNDYQTETYFNIASNQNETRSVTVKKTCFLCAGATVLNCTNCTGGFKVCSACHGSCTCRCPSCAGNRKVVCGTCAGTTLTSQYGTVRCEVGAATQTSVDQHDPVAAAHIEQWFATNDLPPQVTYLLTGAETGTDHIAVSYLAEIELATVAVEVATNDQTRHFILKGYGKARSISDYAGVVEALVEQDLVAVKDAISYRTYFSRAHRQALSVSLQRLLASKYYAQVLFNPDVTDLHAMDGTAAAARRDDVGRTFRRAFARLISAHRFQPVVIGLLAGTALTACSVLFFDGHDLNAYGAGFAVVVSGWLATQFYARRKMHEVVGAEVLPLVRSDVRLRKAVSSAPLRFLAVAVSAFIGLAFLLPHPFFESDFNATFKHGVGAQQSLTEAELDALNAPERTTFAENAEVLAPLIPRIRAMAENGNPKAQALLGMAYLAAIGVEADRRAADEWLTKAEAQGVPSARIGRAWYEVGSESTIASQKKGIAALHELNKEGSLDATLLLGVIYDNATPGTVKPDSHRAFNYFRTAAERGSAAAKANMGFMALAGRGTRKDAGQALRWLKEAARAGDPRAVKRLKESNIAF